jgi:PAP2 superfamily
LYIYGHRDAIDRFMLIFAAGVLLCYAQFPFWPSEPPRVVFFGEDFPLYDTIFRRLNWWMLRNCGIHTSVFPSAHVAGAFSAAIGMWCVMPRPKWVSRFLLTMAVLIAVATVYGRYHYGADAAAGFLMAMLVLAVERCKSASLCALQETMTEGIAPAFHKNSTVDQFGVLWGGQFCPGVPFGDGFQPALAAERRQRFSAGCSDRLPKASGAERCRPLAMEQGSCANTRGSDNVHEPAIRVPNETFGTIRSTRDSIEISLKSPPLCQPITRGSVQCGCHFRLANRASRDRARLAFPNAG